MAGDTEVIKSFMVGLGFDIDEKSLSVFNKSIKDAALRVTALYTSISAMGASMIYAFTKISEGFEEMGYQYHIIAPAINKAIVLRNEMMKAYGAAGINIRQAVVQSVKFNMSMAKTKFALEAIYKSVGVKFFPLMQKQVDTFRKNLYQNMPGIINALTKFVKVVFVAFDIVVQLGMRVWEILGRIFAFFTMLDEKTNHLSTIVLAVLAAWNLLNLSFLATPLGALIAGIVALIALWDDFQVWKEGGKSLFDWSSFIPIIDAVRGAIGNIKTVLDDVFQILFSLGKLVVDVFTGNFRGALTDVGLMFQSITSYVNDLINAVKSLLGVGQAVGTWAQGMGDWAVTKKVADWWGHFGGGGNPAPLGANTTNNSNRVVANMQTNISVQGTASAQDTANATAKLQTGVQRDQTRNLKGVIRQ